MPEITKALCLSTAHIKPETAKWLNGEPSTTWNETPAFNSLPFTPWIAEYGWFIPLNVLDLRDEDLMLPADLRAAMHAARRAECDFLRLDRDGPAADGLEDFGDLWTAAEGR